MQNKVYNVLFLCTGNSAHSVLAEALLNSIGNGRFVAYSAGSQPKGNVHPCALEVLREQNISTEGYRSKSWDEFAGQDAPTMDIVITVCDNAAAEACPIWPAHRAVAHWGIPDPATTKGTQDEIRQAFRDALARIRPSIEALAQFFPDESDLPCLKDQLQKFSPEAD